MTSTERLDLSIIVLTWNSASFIPDCFRSLERAVQGIGHEIIVVDNGSRDDGLRLLCSIVQRARVIRNTTNRGVAAARNQGLAAAIGRYLWLLDVDTRFLDGDMKALIRFMDRNRDVGLAGCRLVYLDGSTQRSCRKFPTVTSKLCRRLQGPRLGRWQAAEDYDPETASVQEVDYVIGAYQLIRREAFQAIGYLDEGIFYGPEDVDYCLRLWKGGWRVIYYPHVSVLHYEQRITQRHLLSRITWEHVVGLLHYFRKHGYWFSREKLYRATMACRQAAPATDPGWIPGAGPQR